MQRKNRTKKIRGWRKKLRTVTVTEITAEGFTLRVGGKKGETCFLPRDSYHTFKDATDAEIRDVVLYWATDTHFYFRWRQLDTRVSVERTRYLIFFYSAEKKDEPPHVHVMSYGAERGGIPVRVSEITTEGFWVHTPKKDYFISRKEFTWFVTATDEEIQDVVIYPAPEDDDYFANDHGDHLRWKSLDIDLGTHTIEHPELYGRGCVIKRDGKKIYIDTGTGFPLDPQPEQE
jgi:hypothetical protein